MNTFEHNYKCTLTVFIYIVSVLYFPCFYFTMPKGSTRTGSGGEALQKLLVAANNQILANYYYIPLNAKLQSVYNNYSIFRKWWSAQTVTLKNSN